MSGGADIHNVAAEQALLGAVFVNNEAFLRVRTMLRAEHFYEPIHGRLFELCEDMIMSGRAATPITLMGKLPPDLDIAGKNPVQYMAAVMAEATTVINAPDYAREIRDAWAARRVSEAAQAATAGVGAPGADVKASISTLLGDLDGIRAELDDKRVSRIPLADCVSGVLLRIDAITEGRIERGATTGLADLDRAIGGLQPGALVVVAGRPGMGKTIVGANFARATAEAGNGCLFFSLEMPSEQIGARMVSDRAFREGAPILSKQVYEAQLDRSQRERVEAAADQLARLPVVVEAAPNLSVGEVVARTRATMDELRKRGVPLRVVVIDYLKFLRASERYRGQRVYEVGEITAGLKALAKDLEICVVLLAQLNRQVELRQDKRPELSDLRESGDIEADADTVLLLYREAYYLKDKTDAESLAKLAMCEDALEIIVAKCRMGAVGVVEAFCHAGASVVRDRRSWGAPQ